ncbi:TolC family protein [Hymenobacter rigui]|nr:TolC family protein [Hymenobacter rigui]
MRIVSLLWMGLSLLLSARPAAAQAVLPAGQWQTTLLEEPDRTLPLLLAAALRHAPELAAMQAEKALAQTDLRLARRALLGSVQLSGGYGYGNVANMTVADPNLPKAYSTTASNRYAAALNLNLPLDKLLNYHQLVQRQQLQVQQVEQMTLARQLSVRQRVIDQYQEVVLAHRLRQLRQQALVSAQLNHQLGEKQFRSGELVLGEMSQLADRLATAQADFATAENRLTTGLLQLEELVGERLPELLATP